MSRGVKIIPAQNYTGVDTRAASTTLTGSIGFLLPVCCLSSIDYHDGETLPLTPLSILPNDQVLPSRFYRFLGHHPQLVDLQNLLDLHQQAVNQTKISADNANNRSYEEYMLSDIVPSPLYLFKRDQRLASDR
jgi:hypothetical protein